MSDDAKGTQRLYRFGPFELNTRTAELRKHGTPVRLQEQPFRILLHLLERPGEVVLREEIQKRLWPDGIVVEFGHGINAAVQRLRNSLQDTAGAPRFIETLARRGYRFIGQVEVVEFRAGVESSEVAKPGEEMRQAILEPPSRAVSSIEQNVELGIEPVVGLGVERDMPPVLQNRGAALALSIGLLAAGVFIGWRLTLKPPTIVTNIVRPPAPLMASAPAATPEAESNSLAATVHEYPRTDNIHAPAGERITRLNLSPDGRSLVFVAGGRLFLQRLDNSAATHAVAVPLAGTDHAGTPFWSSDGKNIAFVAGHELKRMRLDGSLPVSLGRIDTNIAGTWADDNILIGAVGDGIYRVPPSGGPMVRITNVDRAKGEVRHLLPQFLPDKKRFLYVAASGRKDESMLYAGSIDSEEPQAIMPVTSNVVYVPAARASQPGFLISVEGRMLVGQRFNPESLHVSGERYSIAEFVQANMAAGAPVELGNFSAVEDTIAFRYQQAADPHLTFEPASWKNDTGRVIIIRNWTAKLRQ